MHFGYSEELVKGGSEARQAMMTTEERQQLLRSQQSELDGVETYLRLAGITSNETDARIFKELGSDYDTGWLDDICTERRGVDE